MSDHDTDDTDVLLNSDPSGGLNMFLGLSLKELSEKHKNILTCPSAEAKKTALRLGTISTTSCNSAADTASSLNINSKKCTTDLKTLSELDSSDFFNSQGELVLSGLAEWTDSDAESHSENEDAGSEASFTYEPVNQLCQSEIEQINANNNTEQENKIENNHNQTDKLNLKLNSDSSNQDNGKICLDKTIVAESQQLCNTVEESVVDCVNVGSRSASKSFIPQFLSHGRVFDINLLRPASGWNIPLPSFVQEKEGEQIFTRAPNFRTPGGYKPSKNPQKDRDLTDEQICEEVKNMYAFPDQVTAEPDEIKDDDHLNPPTNHTPKVLRFAEEVSKDLEKQEKWEKSRKATKQPGKKVAFDFVGDSNEPMIFGAPCKPTKRKYLVQAQENHNGSGDCPPSSSESSFRSELEEHSVLSSQTKPIIRSVATEVPYSTKVVRGKRGGKKKSTKFSFGYGESESELSPIKGYSGGDLFYTPGSSERDHHLDSSTGNVNMGLDDLKSIWKEIQSRRQVIIGEVREGINENPSLIEDLGSISEAESDSAEIEKGSPGQNLRDKLNGMRSARNRKYDDNVAASSSVSSQSSIPQGESSTNLQQKFLPMLESFASDLEIILQEADINPDDFEDIIGGLGTGGDLGAGIDDLLSEIKLNDDQDINNDPEQGELSDWAKSGAVEFVEKYHEEKFKRQECESEIQKLQKELLNIKQRNAVLEGKMKKKDFVVHKISSSWNKVTMELKKYEVTSKEAVEKLQKEQKELLLTCDESKEKIANYEKELIKTVELADSFKSKIAELQESKQATVTNSEQEKHKMTEVIKKLQKDLSEMMDEKNTALRALKESQLHIDQQKVVYNNLQTKLSSIESLNSENVKKVTKLKEQKETLETHLKNLTVQKGELDSQLKSLKEEIDSARTEKEELLREFGNSTTRQVKKEADRLHDYYNKKVQAVLKSATEKAVKAEATLVDKMRTANLETERKFNQCRERHQLEIQRLKTNYDLEIQALKKDNLQKQLLIKTTAQQLQCGELTRCSEVDRLQSIVSSISSPAGRHGKTKEGDGDYEALRHNKKVNMQYNKFTQNLDLTGQQNNNQQQPDVFQPMSTNN